MNRKICIAAAIAGLAAATAHAQSNVTLFGILDVSARSVTTGGVTVRASSVAAFRQLAAERWNCSMRSCGGPSSCTPGAASSAPAGSSIPRSATTRALPEFQQHLLGGMAWAMRMELPYR